MPSAGDAPLCGRQGRQSLDARAGRMHAPARRTKPSAVAFAYTRRQRRPASSAQPASADKGQRASCQRHVLPAWRVVAVRGKAACVARLWVCAEGRAAEAAARGEIRGGGTASSLLPKRGAEVRCACACRSVSPPRVSAPRASERFVRARARAAQRTSAFSLRVEAQSFRRPSFSPPCTPLPPQRRMPAATNHAEPAVSRDAPPRFRCCANSLKGAKRWVGTPRVPRHDTPRVRRPQDARPRS